MKELVAQFLDALVYERALSPNTRLAYGRDLDELTAFLGDRGVDDPALITHDHLVAWLLAGRRTGLSAASLAQRLVSVRMFLRYLVEEGHLPANVAAVMDSPKLWKSLPEVLSPSEVDRLLAAPDPSTPRGLRDRAALELLYACGLRASELVRLSLSDLHFDDGTIRCVGKGDKERRVPVAPRAIKAVRDWLARGRPLWARPDANPAKPVRTVLLSQRGTPLRRETLWRIVEANARLAGLTKRIYPHLLRHSCASHLLAHGASLRIIQELLGHADISTTQIYTHVDADRLINIHRQFHPRA